MKNLSEKDLKKQSQTLVTYGRRQNNFSSTDTTAGTDPTTSTFTILTTSSAIMPHHPNK